MNLQRREEIRKLIAEIASVHIGGMSSAIEIRALDAMRELACGEDLCRAGEPSFREF